MGQKVTRTDFEWVDTEQIHYIRRKQILKKYPQVKELFGHDPIFKWEITARVLIQFIMLFIMKDQSWLVIFIVAYCFGGVINHSLALGLHEISHNLAFGHARPWANRFLGIFANLMLGVPAFATFKKYHLDHHRKLAVDFKDVDVPTALEGKLFCTTLGKLFWIIIQPFCYTLRPIIVRPMPITQLEILNGIVQVIFDLFVYNYFGGKALTYLVAGTVLAMGLHPMCGHFIAEHYMFEKGYETYSYYGIFNKITFNVGYHNEHHDFPYVSGAKLPELKKLAPDFYDVLPYHTSWTKVVYDFIMEPNYGPYARIKRLDKVDKFQELSK